VAERSIAGQISLVEQLARSLRGKSHDALEVRQAGDCAQVAQIAFQIGLDVCRKPQAAIGFRVNL